ncbi:MAG: branched-chain amino acid transaminase [Chlorobium sp.]|jgi:branched-chain amino acid aminotransferase|uniref:branched-chain amino acid transaminase n=1 Tax=Chlorobium sp. TaxID=1095 RepID=UPI0025BB1BAF|nr:branched-chain amino acid transaminase [Chlorobium sp.]MCF8217199.1 branched-chain amino acid transaminase [Chlorobium sp.]MCF8272046.1 branched-chain amino acid transaminase [Chlorobium sp.]MCF8288417.1 branched-chain amino acid transaminase [Chlorobium sp.]MCF8291996.1 branched-chain amino acid transaminase [Chlorobium sp.]
MTTSAKVWMNGELIDWKDAKIHILSHVIHYGSSTFEGIRCYETQKGSAVLFLDEHIKRLRESSKIYRIEIPYSDQELKDAVISTIHANEHKSCYIRPIVHRGQGALGVNPHRAAIEVAIATWEWGTYLGEDVLENGVDVRVSSWNRLAPNTLPSWAKAGGNYLNSQLIKMEALVDNYAEGIALDIHGYVSEGSGENIFIVRDEVIFTPMSAQSILPGFTRYAIMHIAEELGFEVRETIIPREALYIADEVFLTGTAAEITPVRSIDKYPIGNEKRGPVTEMLQQHYLKIVHTGEDPYNWLTFI